MGSPHALQIACVNTWRYKLHQHMLFWATMKAGMQEHRTERGTEIRWGRSLLTTLRVQK